MAKVVNTERFNNYYQHLQDVSRQLTPEEASVILSGILAQSMHHWTAKDQRMSDLLLQDAKRLESRIRALVMVSE